MPFPRIISENRFRGYSRLAAAVLAMAAGQSHLQAALQTWNGLGSDSNWATSANWLSGTAPVNNDGVAFAGTTQLSTINNISGTTIAGITFNAGAGAFTLSGNAISLSGTVLNSSTSLQTINLNLILNATRAFASTGGDLLINGAIGESGAPGKGLTKGLGGGTVILAGANTFTGVVSVQQGLLSVSSINSVTGGVGSSNLGAPTTIANGTINLGATTTTGTLQYTGGGETSDRVLNLAGSSGGAGVDSSGSGAVTFTSNLTSTGNGNRNFTLSGANTGNNTIAGVILNSATGTTSLVKSGPGTWVLTAANTYTGLTTVSGGTLKLDFSAVGAPTSNIINNTGLTFGTVTPTLSIVGKAGTANTQQFGVISSGGAMTAATLSVMAGAGGSMAVTTGTLGVTNGGSSLNVILGAGASLTTTSAVDSTGIYGRRYLYNGTDWLSNTGTGGSVGAYASYTGLLTTGTTTGANYLLNGSQTQTGNVAGSTLKITTSGASQSLDLAGRTLDLSGGAGLLFAGTDNYSIANGVIRGAGSGGEAYIHNFSSGTLTISAALAGTTPTYGLTKDGNGTVVLSGSNVYSGQTLLGGGLLSISSNANIGNVVTGAQINIGNSGTLQATATFALDNGGLNARSVNLQGGGNASIDVTTGNTLTISGTISTNGGSSLTKTGAGVLKLTAVNTYTGGTIISAGTLLVNGAQSATGLTAVNSGGTLAGTGTLGGAVTVASGGSITPGESGAGVLSTGNFNLNSGGTITMELNSAVAGTGYDQLNVTGAISLAGNLAISLGFSPSTNSLYFLVLNDGTDLVNGTFAGLAQGAIFSVGGQSFQIGYTGDASGNTFTGGNDVVLQAVPEPSTVVLLGLGVSAILWRSRRRAV